MNDELKNAALKTLGEGVAAVVDCVLKEMSPEKGAQVAEWLTTGERDLIVSTVMNKLIVVGTITHPRGEAPPFHLFRIEMNAQIETTTRH